MYKNNQRQKAACREQTKIRVLAIERIMSDGRMHTEKEIQRILHLRYGIQADRKTIYSDICAIDRFTPIRSKRGPGGGFIKHDVLGETEE